MSLKRQTLWSMVPLLVISVINLCFRPVILSLPRFRNVRALVLCADLYRCIWIYGFGAGSCSRSIRRCGAWPRRLSSGPGYWGTGNAIAIPLLATMGIIFGVIGVLFGPKWFTIDPSFVALLRWSFVAGGIGLLLSYYGQFWFILSQAHLDFKVISLLRVATRD